LLINFLGDSRGQRSLLSCADVFDRDCTLRAGMRLAYNLLLGTIWSIAGCQFPLNLTCHTAGLSVVTRLMTEFCPPGSFQISC
jgi:hypothetical protein